MSAVIDVHDLSKMFQFRVKRTDQGAWRNFFHPARKIVTAVDTISFQVGAGTALAFIGPNGAGKSTCIKMLTGILCPSSGHVRVLGYDPQCQRRALSAEIGTVFGQRSQLIFNLPISDSFQLFGRIYKLSPSQITRRQKELSRLFDLEDFIDTPVRKLSLGQRMRAEIAVALIHRPTMIFLDEPTIGLDVVAKRALRNVLHSLNKEQGTTLFLTSHDTGDIEALCERTIVVNHGKIILDAATERLRYTYLTRKLLHVDFLVAPKKLFIKGVKCIKQEGMSMELEVNTQLHPMNDVIKEILLHHEIEDLEVHQPSLDEVIETIYQKQS